MLIIFAGIKNQIILVVSQNSRLVESIQYDLYWFKIIIKTFSIK